MKQHMVLGASVVLLAAVASPRAFGAEVLGAGASLPAPVYAKWAQAYRKTSGNKIVYQSIGSGSGVAQITEQSVDFGASDTPLGSTALEKNGLLQFPTLLGGVVPIVNLPNTKAGDIRLTGALLADIYMGKITTWDDAAIAQVNSGRSLPKISIAVIRRSDSAGTTLMFTDYLSKVSPDWKTRVGRGVSVPWLVGLGGKGDEGVAKFVQRLPGAIGFVEYGYAFSHGLVYTQLKNQSGNFVSPGPESIGAAVSSAWENSGFTDGLTDAQSPGAWPIAGATLVLIRKVQDKPEQAKEVVHFFAWAYKFGASAATESNYVPLAASTVRAIADRWQLVHDKQGKSLME